MFFLPSLQAGARSDINNEEGNASGAGIDGDKAAWAADFVSAVCDPAATKSEILQALGWLRDAAAGGAEVDKAALAMGGMRKKKNHPEVWDGEVQAEFKSVLKNI